MQAMVINSAKKAYMLLFGAPGLAGSLAWNFPLGPCLTKATTLPAVKVH